MSRGYRVWGQHSDYYAGSETSTAIVKGQGRFTGIHIRALTASAGNTFSLTVGDDTASGGTVILSSQNIGVGYYEVPYVRFSTGLHVDITADGSATATGIQYTIYFLDDPQ